MNQPRRSSLLEASTQAVWGIPVGFFVTLAVGFCEFNPFTQAFVLSSAMFVASVIRGYIIRRRFERFVDSMETLKYETRLNHLVDKNGETRNDES